MDNLLAPSEFVLSLVLIVSGNVIFINHFSPSEMDWLFLLEFFVSHLVISVLVLVYLHEIGKKDLE